MSDQYVPRVGRSSDPYDQSIAHRQRHDDLMADMASAQLRGAWILGRHGPADAMSAALGSAVREEAPTLLGRIDERMSTLAELLQECAASSNSVRRRLLGSWPETNGPDVGKAPPPISPGEEVVQKLERLIEVAHVVRMNAQALDAGV